MPLNAITGFLIARLSEDAVILLDECTGTMNGQFFECGRRSFQTSNWSSLKPSRRLRSCEGTRAKDRGGVDRA